MDEDKVKAEPASNLVKMTVAGLTLDPSNNMPIVILKSLDKEMHSEHCIVRWGTAHLASDLCDLFRALASVLLLPC